MTRCYNCGGHAADNPCRWCGENPARPDAEPTEAWWGTQNANVVTVADFRRPDPYIPRRW